MKSDANLRFYFNLQNENDIFFNDKIFFSFFYLQKNKKKNSIFCVIHAHKSLNTSVKY